MKEIKIAELITTKLCHDLSGPISAIHNGVDFLKTSESDLTPKYIELLEQSSQESVERILFYRQLFGVLYEETNVEKEKLHEVSANFLRQKKIKLSWQKSGNEISNKIGKLVLNAMFCIYETLLQAGEIKVEENNNNTIKISGSSASVKINEENIEILKGNSGVELHLKNIQTYILSKLSEDAQRQILVSYDSNNFTIELMEK